MAQRHQNLYARGRTGWSIKRYKEVTLVALLVDLRNHAHDGIPEPACKAIKAAIDLAEVTLTKFSKPSLLCRSLSDVIHEFYELYDTWNGYDNNKHTNAPELRVIAHKKLVTHREHCIDKAMKSVSIMEDQIEKEQQMDLIMDMERREIDQIHLGFMGLIREYPEVFPMLTKKVMEYQKIIGKAA